jgi:hypothetical protein
MACGVDRRGERIYVSWPGQTPRALIMPGRVLDRLAQRYWPAGTSRNVVSGYLGERLACEPVSYFPAGAPWLSVRLDGRPCLSVGKLTLIVDSAADGSLIVGEVQSASQRRSVMICDPRERVRYVCFSRHAIERFTERVCPYASPGGAVRQMRELAIRAEVLPFAPSWRPAGDFDSQTPHLLLDEQTALVLVAARDELPGVYVAATLLSRHVARRLDAAPMLARAGQSGRRGFLVISEELVADVRQRLADLKLRRAETADWIVSRCEEQGRLEMTGSTGQLTLGDGICATVICDGADLYASGLADRPLAVV